MSKIIVVGANHARTAAINTILDQYPGNEVVVYDRNDNISFLGCGMALWIGKQIPSGDGLFYSRKEDFEAKGAKVWMETEVTAVDFDRKTITVRSGANERQDTYDKLILATGSRPIELPIPGADLKNIQYVKLYQNAKEVIEKLGNNDAFKTIAVVGAGYIGVELAEAFRRIGKNVALVDLAPTVLVQYYDEPFRKRMIQNLEAHGIRLALGEKVLGYEGKDGNVSGVRTDKKMIPADMVVQCVGFRPNTPFRHPALKYHASGAYAVDRRQRTSIPDVYAIGDCASVFDNASRRDEYIALATNAVRSGIIAAHNACGTALEHIGVQGSNGICVYDLKMVSTGLTVERAERLGIPVEFTEFEDTQKPAFIQSANPVVRLRIVYRKDNREIIGAQMASEYDMHMGIHMFSLAIEEHVTIDKLKLMDLFFLPHFNQPYNYITMAALSAK